MDKIFLIFILVAAIISGASAPTLYKLLGNMPSPLLSLWRFEVTCISQVPIFLSEYYTNKEGYNLLFNSYLHLPIISGIVLSLYFLFFVLALELTSVARTVLIINSVPLMMVVGNYILYKVVRKYEVIGVGIGIVGLVLISTEMEAKGSTWYGNCVSFAAAISACAYWLVSNVALKYKKLPLWGFVLPANVSTAVFLMIQSGVLYENWDVVGWMKREYVVIVIILGIFPGILTNVGFNYLMKRLRPVVVTSLANISPFVSILIAWLAGFQGVPGLCTWIGGVVLITGNIIVTLSQQGSNEDTEKILEFERDQDIRIDNKLDKSLTVSINQELASNSA